MLRCNAMSASTATSATARSAALTPPNHKTSAGAEVFSPIRSHGSDPDVAELSRDLLRSLGNAEPKTPEVLVTAIVRKIAPTDPQWRPSNPRYVTLFHSVQHDLDTDLQPVLRKQATARVDMLAAPIKSNLDATAVSQLLAFYRSPMGGRYLQFQEGVSRVVSQGMAEITRGLFGGGPAPTALQQPASPEVIEQRQRLMMNSWLVLATASPKTGPASGSTHAEPGPDEAMGGMLGTIALLHGQELDQLQRTFGPDLPRFSDFHKSDAMRAALAALRGATAPKSGAGPSTEAEFKAALEQSVTAHGGAWKAAYLQGSTPVGTQSAVEPDHPAPPASAQPSSSTSDPFPQAPEPSLSTLKAIPPGDQVVLEVEPTSNAGIRIYDLTKQQVYRWELPADVSNRPAPQGVQRSSWASGAGELLFATSDHAYFINKSGRVQPLNLMMPGKLRPFDGMETYAISPDGELVSYYLYTRDQSDRQPDGFGKLYVDVMYQRIRGSAPITLMREERPMSLAWSRDAGRLALGTFDGKVLIMDRTGKQITALQVGQPVVNGRPRGSIYVIRWSPDGTRIGFVYESTIDGGLYTAKSDGTAMQHIKFALGDMDLKSFDWSPDSRHLVFRSFFGAKEICNYQAIGYKFNTGSFPCIRGINLYVSNADGTEVRKIMPEPDYVSGELFWIQ